MKNNLSTSAEQVAHKFMHMRSEGLSALETALTYVEQQSEASVMDVLMFQ